jgi:NDP-sugar pyrophosphorylase family protein
MTVRRCTISQAVILAAGAGKRLHPLTERRSKAMLPVAGRPLVERVMESLAEGGVQSFILVAGAEDVELRQHFDGTSPFNGRVRMVIQERPLGMAHALKQAAPFVNGDFVLSACDNLVASADLHSLLARWQATPQAEALLALLRLPPEKLSRSSAVALDGERVICIVEKPRPEEAPSDVASLPLYIFSPHPEVYGVASRREYETKDAIQALIPGGGVYGMLVGGRATLTYPEDLLALNQRYLADMQPALRVESRQVGAGTDFIPPVYVEAEVQIGRGCRIGPGVYIETGCVVGDGAQVRVAALLRGAHIPAGAVINRQVIGEGGGPENGTRASADGRG